MKSLIIVCLVLISALTNGQHFSVASDDNNVLYAGVTNPLTITVHNVSPKKVIAKTDNGTLKGENGHYIFQTDTGSLAHITLYKRGSNKKIGTATFHVRQIPDPRPRLGAYTSGNISSAYIKNQAGIRTGHESIYYTPTIPITGFTLNIIRNGDYLFKEIKNEGDMFTHEVQKAFQQLKHGDSVVINNIFAKRRDSTLTILPALTFTIKDQ